MALLIGVPDFGPFCVACTSASHTHKRALPPRVPPPPPGTPLHGRDVLKGQLNMHLQQLQLLLCNRCEQLPWSMDWEDPYPNLSCEAAQSIVRWEVSMAPISCTSWYSQAAASAQRESCQR